MISLIKDLDSMPYDILVNREVDKFYYMQKLAELRLMDDKLYEALERVRMIMEARYDTRTSVMMRWKKDLKWLRITSRVL
jgi:hypothetical protein